MYRSPASARPALAIEEELPGGQSPVDRLE